MELEKSRSQKKTEYLEKVSVWKRLGRRHEFRKEFQVRKSHGVGNDCNGVRKVLVEKHPDLENLGKIFRPGKDSNLAIKTRFFRGKNREH